MTIEEKTEHKDKMLAVLKKYIFDTFGSQYVNLQVLQHLPQMWALLQQNNLVLPGMTYELFARSAHGQYMLVDFQEQLGRMM